MTIAPLALEEGSAPAGEAAWPAAMDEPRRAHRAAPNELADAMKAEIAGLERLCEGLASARPPLDRLKASHRAAQDIRRLGGAVGPPLLTEIAGSLCLLLHRLLKGGERTRVTPLREAAIAMHVRRLRQAVEEGGAGAGGEAGATIVAGLRAVTEKASA